MYIMYRARPWMYHMINRNCPGILPKCVSGGVSLHYRDSSLNSRVSDTCDHSQAFHCDRWCVLAYSIKYWVWWKMMKKWTWKLYYPQLWVVFSCAVHAFEIWNFKLTRISALSLGLSFCHFLENVCHIFASDSKWNKLHHIIMLTNTQKR